ncbi:uncharacterized protein CCOS01_06546 [Colletotrichum costaricense]|uniref:Fumarylacetoacetase-like C-terminal domain-containing protein n=1 Tax=Colletotrichum costaricense TaxID=1209916 RepID=A0AAI9YZR8_9PEZI|nr:uncharacterized protein CCOS01_06546 [Colletotrichum costaricense]KAK1528712.1 hypothetical protein CCOS01_06546 [Colletotrichum costaricense]
MSFDRLIRFEDAEGVERYGNIDNNVPASELLGKTVEVVLGTLESGFNVSDDQAVVGKLLCPLPNTPLIICAGVNYKSHASETKFQPPKKPVIFVTPPDRLAGPLDDIKIHIDAQELLDYEGELSVVIAKDGFDISEDEALDYVLGYTVSNDVSARNLHALDVSGYQMGYAKSFDGFGPIGPSLVSPKLIPDPQNLKLTTTVNGIVRQSSDTSQMIWSCRQLISFASRGRTLRRGTIIMTGTPEGVGWHTNGCLNDGDVVEVEIEKLGHIKNKMVFQKSD